MKLKGSVLGTKTKAAIGTAAATLSTVATSVMAFATDGFGAYDDMNADSIMTGVGELFGTIGTYGGGLYAIAAIFTLVLAIRNEDNEGRNKAILNLLAAIALLSMGVIINLFMA